LLSLSETELSEKTQMPSGMAKNIKNLLTDCEENFSKLSERLKKFDSYAVTYVDSLYPSMLKLIPDAPPILYCRGDLSEHSKPAVAIVGARKADSYGLEAAFYLGKQLALEGFTIVSGMAKGVDGAAHKGVLSANGKTIAVLGSGIDIIYPKEHKHLYNNIIKSGAVITEFPLSSPPIAYHFPMRNRIIAGMSLASIVVQADIRSGSLHTVNRALLYGRDVMAVPGSIFSRLSKGTNLLIKEGAPMVENAEDVLSFLGMAKEVNVSRKPKVKMSEIEEKVYNLIDGMTGSYELAETSGINVNELLGILSLLEFKGFVKSSKGVYIRAV